MPVDDDDATHILLDHAIRALAADAAKLASPELVWARVLDYVTVALLTRHGSVNHLDQLLLSAVRLVTVQLRSVS